MNAVILAAGLGKRINYIPKSLIKINNESIIQRQVNLMYENGIKKVYVVIGAYKEQMEKFIKNVEFIYNEKYKEFDNSYSLKKAIDTLGFVDMIVCDGDIIYEEELLKQIIKRKDSSYLIDFSKNYSDSMGFGEKGFSKLEPGAGIGIVKLIKKDLKKIYQKLDKVKWWIEAVDNINLVESKKGYLWGEIDTEEDYNKNKLLFETEICLGYVKPEELFGLMKLIKFEGFHLSKRNLQLEKKALENSLCVSMKHNEKLIGFARIFGDGVYEFAIWDVMIHPDYQKIGLGTKLLKKIVRFLKTKPYIKIFLFCGDKKIDFYKQFGFNLSKANVMEIRND